ncbi:P-loop containing nucleoside triphosphate hydrolase protein [Nemania sp. FL0916]|nr:P-loop containing nucleoside triphosphate hydrolase protein [Nemania sp. FL0916]
MPFLLHASRLARTSYVSRPFFFHHAFSTVTRQTARKGGNRGHKQRLMSKLDGAMDEDDTDVEFMSIKQRREEQKTYSIFRKVALYRLDDLLRTHNWSTKATEYMALGVASQMDFDREIKQFRQSISKACDLAAEKGAVSRTDNPLFWSLRHAFVTADLPGLITELRYGLQCFLMRSKFPSSILATHQAIADMRYPYEWFPATRALQRTVHLHVGPTNSGKTYNALQALLNAKTGIYAGPLRLLAHEVYTRFLAKGKSCALLTGEEQRIPKDVDVYYRSCTVEMAPVNTVVDVAVIDEIQMIGDNERGWAWTQAFLGVQAKELHLCGEERAVELIQSLCATIGDKCIVHRYERLSPLNTMDKSLGSNLGNLEKGDAVVSFSRVDIHSLKKAIEEKTGKRCAIVYGSLPPETRAQQAALFNDPNNNYDFLAASDAIGMGLNLEIKRVVFDATHKRDGNGYRQMTVSEVKQIGGRAGRFRTANQAIQSSGDETTQPIPNPGGLVTAFQKEDLAVIQEAFNSQPQPIETAGLQPPTSAIERLSTYFPPNTPLSFILVRLRDIARLSSRYHLCHLKEMLQIADLIQPFPMSIYDRCVFLNAPVALRDPMGSQVLQSFAQCVSRMEGGDLLDIREVELELLNVNLAEPKARNSDFLRRLEALHKSITLYLWLSYRFSGVFRSQNLAFYVKGLIESRINQLLSGINRSELKRQKRLESIRKRAQTQQRVRERLLGETSEVEDEAPQGEVIEHVGDWNQEGHEEPLYEDPEQLKEITRPGSEPKKSAEQ